jgi:hypothetical protein
MNVVVNYTPPTRAYTHIRLERSGAGANSYSTWATVVAGAPLPAMLLATPTSAFDVRLVAEDHVSGLESVPSSVLTVSYALGAAAIPPPPVAPDAPTGLTPVYNA